MSIAYSSYSLSTEQDTSTLSHTIPAEWTAGDLVVAVVKSEPRAVSTVPDGWEEIDAVSQSIYVYWKTAEASDLGAELSWGLSGGNATDGVVCFIRITGAASTAPVNAHESVADGEATTTHDLSSITTDADNCLVLRVGTSYGQAITGGVGDESANIVGFGTGQANEIYATWVAAPIAGATGALAYYTGVAIQLSHLVIAFDQAPAPVEPPPTTRVQFLAGCCCDEAPPWFHNSVTLCLRCHRLPVYDYSDGAEIILTHLGVGSVGQKVVDFNGCVSFWNLDPGDYSAHVPTGSLAQVCVEPVFFTLDYDDLLSIEMRTLPDTPILDTLVETCPALTIPGTSTITDTEGWFSSAGTMGNGARFEGWIYECDPFSQTTEATVEVKFPPNKGYIDQTIHKTVDPCLPNSVVIDMPTALDPAYVCANCSCPWPLPRTLYYSDGKGLTATLTYETIDGNHRWTGEGTLPTFKEPEGWELECKDGEGGNVPITVTLQAYCVDRLEGGYELYVIGELHWPGCFLSAYGSTTFELSVPYDQYSYIDHPGYGTSNECDEWPILVMTGTWYEYTSLFKTYYDEVSWTATGS